MMQDLIERRCGVTDQPHYLATWLDNLGCSSQQARLVAEHLKETTRLAWRQREWPRLVRQAHPRKAWRLCGAEASLAPWGALSSTWAPTGPQPAVPTSGQRQGYKVFGRLDSCSGPFFSKAPEGRFHSESSAACLREVLSQPTQHVVVIQDGARYHTSKAMPQLFDAQADRLTIEPLPASSPDCKPIEHLWKKIKKDATPLKHFPEFADLQAEVDRALLHLAQTPDEITVLMARYCETLGKMAA
jgi:hypothetical protein